MKMKKLFAALLLLANTCLPSAYAELKLEPPQKLLEKARESRIACREVILDLQQNISEFRDPKTFDAYFNILNDLARIAAEKGVEEIYPNAVKSLGQQMTANGIRWLSASRDSIERILAYHQWMSAEIAFSFLSNVELEEKTLAPGDITTFAMNLDRLIPWIDQAFPQSSGLRLGYRNLLSDRAAKMLARESLTEEERLFWLSKIYSSSGFSSAINLIQDNVLRITKENRTTLHLYAQRLIVVSSRLLADAPNQPFWLINLTGDAALITVMRAVFLQESLPDTEFTGLLRLMQANHLQGLVQQWITRLPSEAYLPEYLRLTGLLVKELNAKELEKEGGEAGRFYARLAAPAKAREKKLEGTYVLTSADGKKWIFTAAFVRPTEVFVGLGDSVGFVSKNFFSLTYLPEEDIFVASERERNDDAFRNRVIKFKLKSDGTLELRDLANDAFMSGKKTESYPDYFKDAKAEPTSQPEGRYEGMVPLGKDLKKKMVLTVNAFKGYTTAGMTDDSVTVTFELNIGSAGTDSVLYLTTGNLGRASWAQLRGTLKNGVYKGYVIIGGRGIAASEFILKKIVK